MAVVVFSEITSILMLIWQESTMHNATEIEPNIVGKVLSHLSLYINVSFKPKLYSVFYLEVVLSFQ